MFGMIHQIAPETTIITTGTRGKHQIATLACAATHTDQGAIAASNVSSELMNVWRRIEQEEDIPYIGAMFKAMDEVNTTARKDSAKYPVPVHLGWVIQTEDTWYVGAAGHVGIYLVRGGSVDPAFPLKDAKGGIGHPFYERDVMVGALLPRDLIVVGNEVFWEKTFSPQLPGLMSKATGEEDMCAKLMDKFKDERSTNPSVLLMYAL